MPESGFAVVTFTLRNSTASFGFPPCVNANSTDSALTRVVLIKLISAQTPATTTLLVVAGRTKIRPAIFRFPILEGYAGFSSRQSRKTIL